MVKINLKKLEDNLKTTEAKKRYAKGFVMFSSKPPQKIDPEEIPPKKTQD